MSWLHDLWNWRFRRARRKIFVEAKYALRGIIVRAAPTCTLWEHRWDMDALEFRPYRKWRIGGIEMVKRKFQ